MIKYGDLTQIEINIIDSLLNERYIAWNGELQIYEKTKEYFNKINNRDNEIINKTYIKIQDFLYQNGFSNLKENCHSIYTLIEPKGHELHRSKSIKEYYEIENKKRAIPIVEYYNLHKDEMNKSDLEDSNIEQILNKKRDSIISKPTIENHYHGDYLTNSQKITGNDNKIINKINENKKEKKNILYYIKEFPKITKAISIGIIIIITCFITIENKLGCKSNKLQKKNNSKSENDVLKNKIDTIKK
jgi:hypothetical protein